MTTPEAAAILADLKAVAAERAARVVDPDMALRVQALKAYQQARFQRTYADLLATQRYGPAARFFLEDLYGPTDFSERDAQFERVVPALVRLFPREIVHTVATLARLHAMSESLDSEMARRLDGAAPDRETLCRGLALHRSGGRAGAAGRADPGDRQRAGPLHTQHRPAQQPEADARTSSGRRPVQPADLPGDRLRYLPRDAGRRRVSGHRRQPGACALRGALRQGRSGNLVLRHRHW